MDKHNLLLQGLQNSFEALLERKIKLGEPVVISNERGESLVIDPEYARDIYEMKKDKLIEILRTTPDQKLRDYIIGKVSNEEWKHLLTPEDFDAYINHRLSNQA